MTYTGQNGYNLSMEYDICGLILEVGYPKMGNTARINVLGKTCLQWVEMSLNDDYCGSIPYREDASLPVLLRPYIRRDSEYTVVLYSDTPLISRKSVLDAVETLRAEGLNALQMTRGYVFRTQYLLSTSDVVSPPNYFFEEEDFITAFSFKQLSIITEILRNRILDYHMENGVYLTDPTSTVIEPDVEIGMGAVIEGNCRIKGRTHIAENCTIGCGSLIDGAEIGSGAYVLRSVITQSKIGRGTTVGPDANIHSSAVIGDGCRIGNYVEIKASRLGDGVKVAHLSYIGDAQLGEGCNVGCGVVFANYDGAEKHNCLVGNKVFIGSNCSLVAPLTIGDGAFIAAGSVVTRSVAPKALVVARAPASVTPDWQGNKFTGGTDKHD